MKVNARHGSALFTAAALLSFSVAGCLPAAAQIMTPQPGPPGVNPIFVLPAEQGDLFSLTDVGKAPGQYLRNNGIYLNMALMEEIEADVADGRKRGAAYSGEESAGVDLDLQQILGIPDAAFHFILDDRVGRSVSYMAATQAPLSDAAGPGEATRLGELSYDQSLFNDHLRILLGRINPTNDFLTSDYSCQFITSTCGQPQSWYFDSNENAFPTSSWGLRMTIKPTLPTYLRFGAYEEDPSLGGPNVVGFSWTTEHAVGVFLPVELGYETLLSTARYPSHYAIGGSYDTSSYIEPASTFGGVGENKVGRSSVWAMLEQTVWRPDPSRNRNLEVFGQVYMATGGYQEYAKTFVVGALLRGTFASRPNDTFGVMGYNYTLNQRTAENVDSFMNQQGRHGSINPAQFNIQVNYGFRIAPGIVLKPDIEYDINPDQLNFPTPDVPNPKIHDALVVGAQLTINIPQALGMPTMIRLH